MKKSLLAFTCLAAACAIQVMPSSNNPDPAESDYTPLVVEGRTWWYTAEYMDGSESHNTEYGVKIGSEVEYEGEKWHKVYVFTMLWDSNKPKIETYDEDSEYALKAYIREYDGRIETIFISDFPTLSKIGMPWYCMSHPATIYDFTADSYIFGNSVITEKANEYISENSGRNFRFIDVNEIGKIDNPEWCIFDNFTMVEGVGVIEIQNPYFRGGISIPFFAPFGDAVPSIDGHCGEQLRYVTNEDNTIFFEHLGGLKLWELDEALNGVNDITVDGGEQPTEWFNLQGVRVDGGSLAPGLYIRRQGTHADKVLVK